jgi:hypothetical protein
MKNSVKIIWLSIIMAFFSCSNEPLIESITSEQSVLRKSAAANFPAIINLPNGFYPEGIVLGNGNDAYVGSLYHGGIYKVDLRTGSGAMLVPAQSDRIAAGLDFDPRTNYIFVADAVNGHAYVYDALSGAEVGAFQLTTETFPGFFPEGVINDVIITKNAAYFTNSVAAEFYKLPLGSDGSLPAPDAAITIPLSGDFTMEPGFNGNGIVANGDGTKLIIGNTDGATLYSVDAATGVATTINVGGPVPNNDGLVLRGNKLYVVQNFSNQISVIKLNSSWDSGVVSDIITDPNYIEPTTAAIKGNMIYVVSLKFFIALPPFFGGDYVETTPYEVVGVKLK